MAGFLESTNLNYLNMDYGDYKKVLQIILINTNASKFYAENEYGKIISLSTGTNLSTTPISETADILQDSDPYANESIARVLNYVNEFFKDESIDNLCKLAYIVYLVSNESNGVMRRNRKYIIIPETILNTNGDPVVKVMDDFLDQQTQLLLSDYNELRTKYPQLDKLGRKPEYLLTNNSTSDIKSYLLQHNKELDGQAEKIYSDILRMRPHASSYNGTTVKEVMEKLGFGKDGTYSDRKTYKRNLDKAQYIITTKFPDSYYGYQST